MKPEFSRPLMVERVPAHGVEESIEATPEERARLARRFGLPAILDLKAHFETKPWRMGGLVLKGVVEAEIEQVCVVTLDPFLSRIEEEFQRYYLGETSVGRHPAVLSLESFEGDEPETVESGAVDLGEVAAETLGLALDPYPRKPGAEFAADVSAPTDKSTHAFENLAKLKKS